MTCGIYLLRFEGTDNVYIGQSTNIEVRYRSHKHNSTHSSTSSTKLYDAFTNYGTPTLEILCECGVAELDTLENEAISIFDSVNRGFNTNTYANSTPSMVGENNSNSKFSNNQIEEAFLKLVDNVSKKDIVNDTKVSITMLYSICEGKSHIWLKDKYPEKYIELLNRKYLTYGKTRTLEALGIPIQEIISPTKEVFKVYNIREFARNNKLEQSGLGRLLSGKLLTHKGWKLKTDQTVN